MGYDTDSTEAQHWNTNFRDPSLNVLCFAFDRVVAESRQWIVMGRDPTAPSLETPREMFTHAVHFADINVCIYLRAFNFPGILVYYRLHRISNLKPAILADTNSQWPFRLSMPFVYSLSSAF